MLGIQWAGHGSCIIATHVKEGLPAARAGMLAGWQAIKIRDIEITDQPTLTSAIEKLKKSDSGRFVMAPTFTAADVSKHNSAGDCWISMPVDLRTQVYNISNTDLEAAHLHQAGTTIDESDITPAAKEAFKKHHIGNVRPDFLFTPGAGPVEEAEPKVE